MKKILLPVVLVFAILLFGTAEVRATHAMGVDMTYECVAPGQYNITLQVYRDCNGIDMQSSHLISFSSAQCGVNGSITVTQVGPPEDITPVCPQQSNTACSGGGQYGVEKYTYTGVLNLPPGCGSDWTLSWSLCCRNNAITNLSAPGNESIYIDICLNNTLSPCNNSPFFLNNPIPFYCVNQPVNYNHGVIDIDGDSLAFHPVASLSDGGAVVNYQSPYNANGPFNTNTINPYTVDPINGDINYTPDAIQIAVAAIRIDEYRNGQLIGCVVRDMQFTIINCSNQLPTATGVNGGNNFTLSLPACSDTCFTIGSNDPDAGDNVTMTGNNGIPGATFTTSGGSRPTGTFCWAPTSNDVGTNFFTVTVQDDHCPITGNNTYSYTINVLPSSEPPVDAGPDVVLCPGQSTTLTATVVGATPTSYSWTDGTNTWSTRTITVNPATTTLYTVTAYYASGCRKTDAVLVTRNRKPIVSIFPTNATVCAGNSVNLLVQTNSTSPTYYWNPTANLSCTNCPNPIASPTASVNYCVWVSDASGCPSDTVCSIINTTAPPPPQSCAVLYATVNGNGNGTRANPASLQGAIALAQCNNSIIKLGTGTYTLSNPISNITSYTTLEGGFDPVTWVKTSAPGATTIYRNNQNPEGIPNAPRLVAIYMNSQSFFSFHDITFQTQDCPATVPGNIAMSNYIFHMTSCSDYEFVRCRFIGGNAGNGVAGTNGINGANGAAGANGTLGDIDNTGVNAPGGNGGAGGGAGAGTAGLGGGNGSSGSAGASSANSIAGGGGGGGGAGGSASSNGGDGGTAGGVNGAGGPAGGSGGSGGSGTFSGDGSPGTSGSGVNGTPGTNGAAGAAGSFVGGFFLPGGYGGDGTNGTGGTGGSGGGGGGGQSCTFCTDGTGDGGGGGGGGGAGGTFGTGGSGGGASIVVYAFNNGNNGVFTNDEFFSGTAGLAGAGGTGGSGGIGGAGGTGANSGAEVGAGGNGGRGGDGGAGGDGGSGSAGSAGLVYVDGGSFPVTDIAFNLSSQPVINVADVSCTNRDVTFTSPSSGNWDFNVVSSPQTATGASVITRYSTFGRKTITFNGNIYEGFYNIPIDDNSYIPDITTTAAPYSQDTFIICQGSTANFNAIIPAADAFDWDFGGAVSPNTYTGPNFRDLNNLQFNTLGIFKIKLRINTSCCGYSPYDSIWIIVDQTPTLSINGLYRFCPGDSITLTASGAYSNYYTWTPATGLNTTQGNVVVAKPANTITYLLTGYSEHFYCRADTVITLTRVDPATLTFTTTPAICGNTGSVTVNPSPAGSYGYSWNDANNQTTQTATALQAGSYAVTVTDLTSNCTASGGTALSSGGSVQAYIDSTANISCFGLCDGTARVRGISGSGTYSYLWSNGATTARANNLCAGPYSVTVTDVANGCTASTTTNLNQPLAVAVTIVDTVDATCATLNNGSAQAEATGGTGLFGYLWSDPAQQDSVRAVNLYAGNYTVTAIDQNACTATASVTILAPPPVVLDTVTVTDNLCNGDANGSIIVSVTGGDYPYTYNWVQLPTETDSIATGIPGATYTIIAADVWGCKDTIIVPVNEPLLLSPAIVNTDSVKCFGGSDGLVELGASGGTAPYQYSLDGVNFQSSPIFSALAPNTYTATIVDAHLCDTTIQFTIYQPSQLNVALAGVTDVKCFGGNDGTATVNITGGTPTYTGTLGAQSITASPYTFTNLAAGNYNITATDANNCTATVTAQINQPTQLALSLLGVTPTSCYGSTDGGINVTAGGGTPVYSYSLDGGAPQANGVFTGVSGGNHIAAVIDANLCIDTLQINVPSPPQTTFLDTAVVDVNCFGGSDGSIDLIVTGTGGPWTYQWSNSATTQDISGLATGYYQVTVREANNCSAVGIDSIFIAQPTDLALSQTTQNVSCFGGADGCINITATGGTPAYQYVWSNGSAVAQNCNLVANTYSVTVYDARQCADSLVNIPVTEPTLLTVNPVVTPVSCPGFSDGSFTANAAGGTPAYTYAWSPAGPNADLNSNLPAGIYNVTVTDANNCSVTGTGTIIELPGIALDALVHNVLCYPLQNGFIDLSAVTNNPPATYRWNTGATTQDIYSIPAGPYSVTITDANNCVVDTNFVVLNDDAFSVTASPHDTTIDLGSTVDLLVAPNGVNGGNIASVVWQPSNALSCGDCVAPTASPVQTIYYIATATSDSGCIADDRVNITVIPKYVVFIPNVFTPNQDGANDYFEVFGNKEAWKQFEVQIYDRWGEKVYDSNDMNFKWDGIYKGRLLQPAVFVYVIRIVYLDNYTDKIYKGSVTLVR